MEREKLYNRINERVFQMVEQGTFRRGPQRLSPEISQFAEHRWLQGNFCPFRRTIYPRRSDRANPEQFTQICTKTIDMVPPGPRNQLVRTRSIRRNCCFLKFIV